MRPISMFDANIARVLRGGSWYGPLQFAPVACRYRWTTGDSARIGGFRLYTEVR